jgi:heme-degrading monooxygenase HmoA
VTTATLINCFQVPADREPEFLKLWHEADALLRSRGGYLTTRLHKALQPDSRYQYINIAELDSLETWKTAITSPEFTAITAQMAEFRPAPGLYTVTVSHGRDERTRPSQPL